MARRVRLSTKAREALLEEHGRICHLCGGRIEGGQGFEVSHPIPLAAGGEDEPGNRAPAHKKCHAKQTAEIDAPLIAKVRRIHQKHVGAKAPSSNPIPGSRNTRFRKRMDGTVVLRQEANR